MTAVSGIGAAALCTALLFAATPGRAAPARVLPALRTPSGNIACVATRRTLFCTIARSAYGAALQDRCLTPPGQLPRSGVDWQKNSPSRLRFRPPSP